MKTKACTFYDKPLNASLNAPILTAKARGGVVVDEFVWQPLGDYRDSGAPWGLIGLDEQDLIERGFSKRAEGGF